MQSPGAIDYRLPRWPSEQEQLVLSTTDNQSRLFIRQPASVSSIQNLRLLEDLREAVTITPFGVSERCAAERSGSDIIVTCAAGSDVAGILLQFGGVLPAGAAAKAFVATEGSPEFGLEIVKAGSDATKPTPVADRLHLPLPDQTKAPLQLVILASERGGTLHLTDLRLVPTAGPHPLEASAWVWQPDAWQNNADSTIRSAAARGLTRLYISLIITDGKVQHADKLARFIRAAARENIAVEAVEGDPRMVLDTGLSHGLQRARAIARYQKKAPADSRLAGVQFDIEPYVLPDWGSPTVDHAAWSAAINSLSQAVKSPVNLVLPFWIAYDEAGATFLQEIKAAVSGITVMSYRADGALAAAFAQPLLHWGMTAGKPVRIALEAGPVAPESEETFIAATAGQLALQQKDGQVMATLLPRPAVVAGARMYASRGAVVTRPERISFLGNEPKMIEAAEDVAQVSSAWTSFAGVALHGLSWPGL